MHSFKPYWIIICMLILSAIASAQNVQNVAVRQVDTTIEITYDLDADAVVSVSAFSGYKALKMEHLEGAIGEVTAGNKCKIIWNVLEDYNDFVFDNVCFTVSAAPAKGGNRTIFTAQYGYGAIPQHSGGLLIGQNYKYAGWYASFRSNFSFKQPTKNLSCDKGGLVNGMLPLYSGYRQQSHMLVTAGLLVDLTGNHWRKSMLALYFGAGYGWRYSLWETTRGQLIRYNPTYYHGVAAQAGVIGSIRGLTLSAGVATIGFNYLELEVGIGYTINHKSKK